MGDAGFDVVGADDAPRGVRRRDGRETAAWAIALALALLMVPLAALLARPAGTLLTPKVDVADLLPWAQARFRPEPTELGGYLLALALTAALAVAILALPTRAAPVGSRATLGLSLAARAGMWLVVVASVVEQGRLHYERSQGIRRFHYFTTATLVGGVLIAVAIVAAIRSTALRLLAERILRDTRVRRVGVLVLVVSITAVWMLHAIQTDRSIGWAEGGITSHLVYTSDETFAVLNGLTPFVSAATPYATLWPYVLALPLVAFGKTLLVFTTAAATISGLALLAGFGILRRVTRSAVGALLLYLPFLGTSLALTAGHPDNGLTAGDYLADFPLRDAGPLLLAWLTARELDRSQPRAPVALFAAAGLVVLNNVGFGVPALAGTLIAVGLTRPSLLQLVRGAAAGLAIAVAAVTAVTLARAGALPHFGGQSQFSRYYLAGFNASPMHSVLGLHLLIVATYVAAIATAAVQVRSGATGRVLTGMLLWNGVFGLAALSYFVAESAPMWLMATFWNWALTVMLLAVVVVRRLAGRAARLPDPADLAVLFAVGVLACSLGAFPTPWSQIDRLAHRGDRPLVVEEDFDRPDPAARAFVASLADGQRFYLKRGAPVAFLFESSHRVADAYGVRNVSPYASAYEAFTRSSLLEVVAALRRAGGNTVVMSLSKEPAADVFETLSGLGFGLVTRDGIARVTKRITPASRTVRGEMLIKWVDLRALHPRALRDGRGFPVAP